MKPRASRGDPGNEASPPRGIRRRPKCGSRPGSGAKGVVGGRPTAAARAADETPMPGLEEVLGKLDSL